MQGRVNSDQEKDRQQTIDKQSKHDFAGHFLALGAGRNQVRVCDDWPLVIISLGILLEEEWLGETIAKQTSSWFGAPFVKAVLGCRGVLLRLVWLIDGAGLDKVLFASRLRDPRFIAKGNNVLLFSRVCLKSERGRGSNGFSVDFLVHWISHVL